MGFFEKIKAGLTRTKENIGHSFDQLFAGELNDDFYDELEETLILGDMGVDTTMKAVEELRRRAKAVNFGIVYGISAFALAQDIGVTVAEAKAYMDRYFETYSTLRQYMTDVVAQAEQDGYVQTMMHRRRPLPELKSSNFNLREFGKRVALNMPVQGSAADIMKLAMVRVHDRLKREGLRARLLMQVHDELIAECPAEEQAQVKRILTEEMEHAAALSVPLTVDAHCGKNWLEAKG